MEANRLMREEEEAKQRVLEERIRNNQINRLKTLEQELHRKDAQFDQAKQQEYEKLKKAEEDRVRRSLDFRRQMDEEQKAWKEKTERWQQELEQKIRQEEQEIRNNN